MPSETNNSTAVVPLRSLPQLREARLGSQPPVWLPNADDGDTPLSEKCGKSERNDGVCCKELKDKDRRTIVNPDVVRDVIIGLSDGLTVPFALTAGLSSLGESRLVVLGGIAELIAGAISMGVGGFLASKAERDHYRFLRSSTASRVQLSCDGEMEREVYAILSPVGIDERTSRGVMKRLRGVECDVRVDAQSSDEETQSSAGGKSGMGLTPFFLKFGIGLEDVPTRRLYWSAITIGLGYLIGGIIPLFPYFFFRQGRTALMYSCILTGFVLLIFGVVKARVTGAGTGVKGCLWGAIGTLLVGGTAACAAYWIVALLKV